MTARSPSPGLTIRRATSADAEEVAAVYLASLEATYAFPMPHTADEARAWVRDLLVATAETWVAEDRGRVVGMMTVGPGELDQLYVAPDRLGEGIGSALLRLAKERSPEGLRLYTFQVNDRARRFYERNGFIAEAFGDGQGNEERQPDVRYAWTP